MATRSAPNPQKRGGTVALGCALSPETFDGKEGVDGSSPSEGLQNRSARASRTTCSSSHVRWVWSRLWSFRVRKHRRCAACAGSRNARRRYRPGC